MTTQYHNLGSFVPLPLSERMPFEWSVPVGQMKRGRNNHRVSVEAYETCCEYLYVHESIEIPGFSVSHKLTGYALAQGVPTLRAAQYVAGALKPLFPRWSDDGAPYFKATLWTLDRKFINWILDWR